MRKYCKFPEFFDQECFSKLFCISIAAGFEVMFKRIESYSKQGYLLSSVKSFRAIFKNELAKSTIKILNGLNKATSTLIFSIPYVNTPHSKLTRVLNNHLFLDLKVQMSNSL